MRTSTANFESDAPRPGELREQQIVELARIGLRRDVARFQLERAEHVGFLLFGRARAAGQQPRVRGRRADRAANALGGELRAGEHQRRAIDQQVLRVDREPIADRRRLGRLQVRVAHADEVRVAFDLQHERGQQRVERREQRAAAPSASGTSRPCPRCPSRSRRGGSCRRRPSLARRTRESRPSGRDRSRVRSRAPHRDRSSSPCARRSASFGRRDEPALAPATRRARSRPRATACGVRVPRRVRAARGVRSATRTATRTVFSFMRLPFAAAVP